MTYVWIVFAADTSELVKEQWIAATADLNGWFDGIPPRLLDLAASEAWTLPHVYVEIVPVEPATE